MKQIRSAGIGVVVVSWYPPNTQDPVQRGHELTVEDHKLMPALLESAAQAGLEIALHVEPYEGRNADNLRRHLEYVHSTYGSSPALQRRSRSESSTQEVPVFYLYDQYRQPASEWAKILDPQSTNTVRNTDLDGFFICLVVEYQHLQYAVDAHCDGIYTYVVDSARIIYTNITLCLEQVLCESHFVGGYNGALEAGECFCEKPQFTLRAIRRSWLRRHACETMECCCDTITCCGRVLPK